jgi:hypothetical protein
MMTKTKTKRKPSYEDLVQVQRHNRIISMAIEVECIAARIDGTGTANQLEAIAVDLRKLAAEVSP